MDYQYSGLFPAGGFRHHPASCCEFGWFKQSGALAAKFNKMTGRRKLAQERPAGKNSR